jgi:hypothetical protein
MIRRSRARHRSMAAWLLMVVLTLAPSLALAAMACVSNCCPAAAIDASEADLEDCSAGFARQTCCSESPDPLTPVVSPAAEVPSLHAILPGSPKLVTATPWRPTRAFEADLALRTSPFRLSVVLLI